MDEKEISRMLKILKRNGCYECEINEETVREIRERLVQRTEKKFDEYTIAKRKCLELSYNYVLD